MKITKKAVQDSHGTSGQIHKEIEKPYRLTKAGQYDLIWDAETFGVHLWGRCTNGQLAVELTRVETNELWMSACGMKR